MDGVKMWQRRLMLAMALFVCCTVGRVSAVHEKAQYAHEGLPALGKIPIPVKVPPPVPEQLTTYDAACLRMDKGTFVDVEEVKGLNVAANTPLTMEAWVYVNHGGVTVLDKHSQEAVHDASNHDTNYMLVIGKSHDDTRIGVVNTMNPDATEYANAVWGNTHLCPGSFHHIAVSFSGNRAHIFADGVADGSHPWSVGEETRASLLLGRDSRGHWLDGVLAEVRLWSVARTQKDIQHTMMCQLPRSTKDLIALWRLNEREGNVAKDFSDSHYDGMVQSPHWVTGQLCPPLGNSTCQGDTCACVMSYTDFVPTCKEPEVVDGCPSDCSGHGECIDNKVCKCEELWSGEDCSVALCPNKCSGHGSCSGHNCTCFEGFGGLDCSRPVCQNDCHGHGKCLHNETDAQGMMRKCECFEGWEGVDCGLQSCPANCTVHGTCNHATGVCECSEGWREADCMTPACPNHCSRHGDCQDGVCFCHTPWSGHDCSKAVCPNACSGHGKCDDKTGICNCMDGWSEVDCSVEVPQCPNMCSGKDHGKCEENGKCTCFDGWGGEDCGEAVVKCPKDCSGHGRCQTDGTCECDKDWMRADCGTKRCPGDCSGHGACVNGTCECDPMWHEEDCSLGEACPNDCTYHGECRDRECACHEGWQGIDCSKSSIVEDLNSCNGIPGKVNTGGACGVTITRYEAMKSCLKKLQHDLDFAGGAPEVAGFPDDAEKQQEAALKSLENVAEKVASEQPTGFTTFAKLAQEAVSNGKALKCTPEEGRIPVHFAFREVNLKAPPKCGVEADLPVDPDNYQNYHFGKAGYNYEPFGHFGGEGSGWSPSGAYWGNSKGDDYKDTLAYHVYPVSSFPSVVINGTFELGVNTRPEKEVHTIHWHVYYTLTGDEVSVLASNSFKVQSIPGTKTARVVQGTNSFPMIAVQGMEKGFFAIVLRNEREREDMDNTGYINIKDNLEFRFARTLASTAVTRRDGFVASTLLSGMEKQFSLVNGVPLTWAYKSIDTEDFTDVEKFECTPMTYETKPWGMFGSEATGVNAATFFWGDTEMKRYRSIQGTSLTLPTLDFKKLVVSGTLEVKPGTNTRALAEKVTVEWKVVYSPDGSKTQILGSGMFITQRDPTHGEDKSYKVMDGTNVLRPVTVKNWNEYGSVSLYLKIDKENDHANGGHVAVQDNLAFEFHV